VRRKVCPSITLTRTISGVPGIRISKSTRLISVAKFDSTADSHSRGFSEFRHQISSPSNPNPKLSQAGHLVPAYQPETAYRVFERIIKGLSIATGEKIIDVYSTTGTVNSTKSLIAPASPEPTCFYRVIASCDEAGWLHIVDRTGVVYNGVVYNSTDDYPVLEPLPPYPPAPTGNRASSSKTKRRETPMIQQRSTGTSVRAPSAAALLVAIGFCIGLLPGAV